MTFAPVVPSGGYAGWSFLNRTMSAQRKAFDGDPTLQRDMAYFRDKIGKIDTAEQLVTDRRLLDIALSAFGLEGDINNRAFLQKILEGGTIKPEALGNRLADKRYLELARAFGFGDFAVPNTKKSDFADKILSAYRTRKFESAVGDQNSTMRLALNARRELTELAGKRLSQDGKWFTALGSPPLRTVLQTAFGLPQSFAGIDLDKQLGILKSRADALFGSSDPAGFSDPEKVEKLVRLFLVRADIQSSGAAPSPALSMLQAMQSSGQRLSRYI